MTTIPTTESSARPGFPSATLILALLCATIFTLARAVGDWSQLALGRLPDNDDMMRLAEVRDWMAGQKFHDLVQHRLGPPGGASMHWSRLADAGPALLLGLLTPLLGRQDATLAMLVLYQALLFLAYLLLAARNAGLLIGKEARPVAVIFAALAFPTVSLFIPGRIDHHALQIVLTMILVGMLVSRPTFAGGATGGIAAGASLSIGLEVAPEIALLLMITGLLWVRGGHDENRRAAGFSAGLGGTTLALLLLARPLVWPGEWCDGFTPGSSNAALVLAAGWGALALAGVRAQGWRMRLIAAVPVGAAVLGSIAVLAPACFTGPYGALDPYLQNAWMSNVAEAREMGYGGDWPTAIGYGGLCLLAVLALPSFMREPASRERWWPVALLIAGGAVLVILQIRVSYIMAGIATLPFTALMTRLRRTDATVARLALWVVGSGFTWNVLGIGLGAMFASPALSDAKKYESGCVDGRPLNVLARLPRGVVMSPLDTGAYVIGMTPHRAVAAPYHRNNVGNLAAYRFFLSPPEQALAIARAWQVTYVVTCPTSLDQLEVAAERPGSLIEALQSGRTPGWLRPLHRDPAGGLAIYGLIAER